MGRYTAEILQNAEKIIQLDAHLRETRKHRNMNKKTHSEWERASEEYRGKYMVLAFPGGLDGADEKILAGDAQAMEAAVCFIECRPYFFRSGYMYQGFLRKLKRAPLTADQKVRYERVREAYKEYRKARRNEHQQ